jgi:hypothetical protein
MADSIIPAAPLPTPSLPPSLGVILPAAPPPPSPNLPQNPVVGTSPGGPGVLGESNTGTGVYGQSLGQRTGPTPNWLPAGDGVLGEGRTGVHGRSTAGGDGVHGESPGGFGVRGDSPQGFAAVHGNGGKNGMWGYTVSANDAGVFGSNDGSGNGVTGYSKNGGFGVRGDSPQGFAAVHGNGGKNGVWGYTTSKSDSGVFGSNDGDGGNGVAGYSKNGIGILGWSDTGLAGNFNGRVVVNGPHQCNGDSEVNGNHHVTGKVNVDGDVFLTGADCAEQFDVSSVATSEPGTVMVITPDSRLEPNQCAYDKKVAGVISGAGGFRPGIILDKQVSDGNRAMLALVGKVYCKVDAQFAAIEVGDLLTTSPTPGHAMKADDPTRAFGAVIGKALGKLRSGQGLIPILVGLQ